MDVSNHNITKYHSAAVSQTKNDHIQLYLVIMKVKKKLYEMVNSGLIKKGMVDKFA